MTKPRKLFTFIRASLFVAAAILGWGCTDENTLSDEEETIEGTPTEVTLSLEALRSPELTRDESETVQSDPELIASWWIAFVDRNGTVRKIVKRSDAETGISSNAAPVEVEKFKCIVPAGLYNIYAFANITPSELEAATGILFESGKSIDISAAESALWATSLNNWEGAIPMSGFKKGVRVKNTVEETFAIEVVRMVAKMEFLFTNVSQNDIEVSSVTVDPVTTGSISLFPTGADGISYSHLGNSAYSPQDDPGYSATTFSFSEALKIAGGTNDPISKSIYLQESVSGRENDEAFTIGVKVKHYKDNVAVSETQQYNITRDILSYINRNDHIRIPIKLSRYDINVDALFYPPIGGYPAAQSSFDPEGSQIFTFHSGGDFAITAQVFDKESGCHVAPAYYSVTLDEVNDPDQIFVDGGPTHVAGSVSLPDEVAGTLTSNKGKATATLTVKIYSKAFSSEEADITDTYTRKIYIIRD